MNLRVLLLALIVGAALASEYEYDASASPSASHSAEPSSAPAPEPTSSPAPEHSSSPAPEHSSSPAPEPSSSPAPAPSSPPAPEPSSSPAPEPSPSPSPAPAPPKSTHNHTLFTDCIRVDFDVLAINDGLGRALNVSNVTAAFTSVTGACIFIVNPKNTTYNLHVATIDGTLTLNSSVLDVTFSFVENAFYSKSNEYLSGDRSVSLLSIATVTTIKGKAQSDLFLMNKNDWKISANSSFTCNYYFNFTASTSADAAAVASLQLGNVQAQAFLPQGVSTFSKSDANSVNCPAIIKLKTNKIGLIIGGIIAALAVFGILSFSCSKCKNNSRAGYRSLNDSV